jgi:hypothetical protein
MDKIIVEYQLKTEALRKELGEVKGKLSDTEKQIETSGNKMSNVFKNVGKAIGAAFSVQMLIQFAKKSLEVYDIQAKAEASLLQALKGREDVQKRLMLQASELQKVTLFGDEATIQAQAMLAKFGMTETQIKRLIPLIQDYATISGQDLTSAADMVARSVATSTNALVRYGVEIEGAAGSSERMESAVDALSEMVGGQAVAAAQAGTGAVTQFNNAWGDFAESVGEDILPALTRLTNAATDLLYVVDSVPEGTPGFFEKLFTGGTVGILEYARALGKVREQMESGGLVTDEEVFNRAQEDFAQWRKEWKDTYATLEEAGDAYIENLSAKIRKSNGLLAESSEEEKKAIYEANKQRIIQIEAVQLYVEEMTKTVKVTRDASKETKKLKDTFDDLYPPVDALTKAMTAFGEAFAIMRQSADGIYVGFGVEDLERTAAAIGAQAEGLELLKGTTAEYVDTTQEAADWTGAWFDISRSVFQGLNALSDQQTQKYINNLQAQLDAGQITQEQFEKQRTEALRKQAKQDKQYSIFRIILDTASAVINFLTAKPPNVPASVAAGVAGAIQLGVAVNAPVPAFAEGVVGLNGDGTETSDSILARLSKGESVITAKGTRQDKGLFEAANKMKLEEYINKNYVLPVLLKKQQDDKAMFDDYRLYRSLQDLRHSDKANTRMIVNAIKTEKVNSRRYWA